MQLLRKILFPISIIYWMVTYCRNILYNLKIFSSKKYNIPIIGVGNLSVGGTGKTPQIEYLIRLLSNQYKIATLSRGYKRKSKGYFLANENSTAELLGDEPFQFYTKYPETLVAVDSNRRNGIEKLLQNIPKPEVILLDDAFQHRKVKLGFSILLTTYNDLFTYDFILPFGNLREPSMGKKRADVLLVTKCPAKITPEEQQKISTKLQFNKPIFYSTIVYENTIFSETKTMLLSDVEKDSFIAIAGIAKPKPFFEFLRVKENDTLTFADHHFYETSDCEKIIEKAKNKIIITTEKDYTRLKGLVPKEQLFYLPIQTKLISNATNFEAMVLNYIKENS